MAVLGHNGSGKSTLAKHLNAILLPSGGKVYVDGIDTADEDKLLDIRRTVGMVFQNPDNQIVANVVEEDVAFAPENLGVPRRRSAGGWTTPSRPWACTSTGSTPPPALRRTETAGGHCRCHRYGAPLHCAGRAHRHAGPHRPGGGHEDHP